MNYFKSGGLTLKAKSKRLKFISILMAFVIGATSITAFSAAEETNDITEITETTEIDTSETEEISEETQEQASDEQNIIQDIVDDNSEQSISDSKEEEVLPMVDDDIQISQEYQEINSVEEAQKDWTIKATLFDSSVNGGNTELQSINWDASDGGYGEGSGRNVTLRISWQKFPGKQDYERDSMQIYVPKPPIYWNYRGFESSHITDEFLRVKEQLAHSGWELTTVEKDGKDYYVFYNNETISSYQSKEGHINIVMQMTPLSDEINPGDYENTCEVSANHVFNASMRYGSQEIAHTDDMPFSYRRTYTHEWQRNPNKLSVSFYGVNANFEQNTKYIKYELGTNKKSSYHFPEYKRDLYVEAEFPSGQKVYSNNILMQPYEGNKYRFPINSSTLIVVGYPQSIYNETNNNEAIEQVFNLYHEYEDDYTYIGEDVVVNFNLADYKFTYDGDLYAITYQHMSPPTSNSYDYRDYLYISDKIDLQKTSNEKGQLNGTATYTDFPMDILIGTDYFAITDENGSYRPLDESERKIYKITWFQPQGVAGFIGTEYDVELYIQYQGNNYYVYTDVFKSNKTKTWTFNEQINTGRNIVSFYFKMKNVKETVIWAPIQMTWIPTPEEGTYAANGKVYTSDYIKVYNGSILENETELSNYNTLITKDDIAQHDIDKHRCYIQRDGYAIDYREFEVKQQQNTFKVSNKITKTPDGISGNQFVGGNVTIQLTGNTGSLMPTDIRQYGENIPKEELVRGYRIYTLLPQGITLDESKTKYVPTGYYSYTDLEIVSKHTPKIFESNGSTYSYSNNLLEKSTTYSTIDNWNGTGRQLVVLTTNFGRDIFIYSPEGTPFFQYQLGFTVDFEAYLKSGGSWDIRSYGEFFDREATNELNDTFYLNDSDDGKYDSQETDINGNNETDAMAMGTANLTITAPSDSIQEVSARVLENDTELFESSVKPKDTYEYRFKVSTGNNKATNIVIYTSIEDQVKNNKGEFVSAGSDWKGLLQNINVSQTRELGLFEKIYWSESSTPGNIGVDSSWKEYTEATDKAKIKSLAIEIVDEEGNPAIIPGFIELQVGIVMKAPEKYMDGQAHIACWTGWNNINSLGQIETTVTGMPSNIVSVSLAKPETRYITIHKSLFAFDEESDDWGDILMRGISRPKLKRQFMFVFENESGELFNVPVVTNSDGERIPIELGEYTLKEISVPGYYMGKVTLYGGKDSMYEIIEIDPNNMKINITSEYNDYIIDVENVKNPMGYDSNYNVRNYFKIQ